MKKPKGVSLEESLFERVKIAARDKRESASKWIEDAIYERFERAPTNEQPVVIPKTPLPTKKAAAYRDEHREDRRIRGKGAQGARRSKTKYKTQGAPA